MEHADIVALRKGQWKLIPARGERGAELYDLATDIGETKNLAGERPEIVRELAATLDKLRASGRSRP